MDRGSHLPSGLYKAVDINFTPNTNLSLGISASGINHGYKRGRVQDTIGGKKLWKTTEWNKIKIVTEGNIIKVFLDGTLVIDYQDNEQHGRRLIMQEFNGTDSKIQEYDFTKEYRYKTKMLCNGHSICTGTGNTRF